MQPIIENLKVDLTDEDLKNRSKLLAKLLREYQSLENEKKEVNADFKHKMEAVKNRACELRDVIHTGKEIRPVECFLSADYRHGLMITRRSDTGEEIDSRPMTTSERQQEFKFRKEEQELGKEQETLFDKIEENKENVKEFFGKTETTDQVIEQLAVEDKLATVGESELEHLDQIEESEQKSQPVFYCQANMMNCDAEEEDCECGVVTCTVHGHVDEGNDPKCRNLIANIELRIDELANDPIVDDFTEPCAKCNGMDHIAVNCPNDPEDLAIAVGSRKKTKRIKPELNPLPAEAMQ